ncbi:MAG TPA: MOSC N-terminal beta barrel domain-containing protein, partial [Gaiellaceae bacterium]
MSARVAWISLTPVKATKLHLVEETDLLESGVRGDRLFYFVTERGRLVSDKDHGPLQLVRSHYDEDADLLSLTFADG